MNPAQNTQSPNDSNKTPLPAPIASGISPGISREHEIPRVAATETVSEVGQEIELPIAVEKAGVEVIKDTIELPPDMKKLGVASIGPTGPAITTSTLPAVVLPISDQTVVVGLHTQILSSLRWLAVWCVKKLKKAHIALKNIHGKIIRVKM